MGIMYLASLFLIALQATGDIDWPWWAITAPIMGRLAILAVEGFVEGYRKGRASRKK